MTHIEAADLKALSEPWLVRLESRLRRRGGNDSWPAHWHNIERHHGRLRSVHAKRGSHLSLIAIIQGGFFNWDPPKNHKYGKKVKVSELGPP